MTQLAGVGADQTVVWGLVGLLVHTVVGPGLTYVSLQVAVQVPPRGVPAQPPLATGELAAGHPPSAGGEKGGPYLH